MRVKLNKSIVVHLSSNIEHEAQLWFEIFAQSLEEPFVRIDFAIISMLNGEHYVHSTAFQNIILKADIPSSHLENVKNIFWMIFFRNIIIHNILERPHFVHVLIILRHKFLRDQQIFIKKAFISSELFEGFRNAVIAITDYRDTEVILGQVLILVFFCAEAIIVMNYTAKRVLELVLVFIVHSDADGHGRVATTLPASSTDIRQKAVCKLDVASLPVLPEARSTHLRIKFTAR